MGFDNWRHLLKLKAQANSDLENGQSFISNKVAKVSELFGLSYILFTNANKKVRKTVYVMGLFQQLYFSNTPPVKNVFFCNYSVQASGYVKSLRTMLGIDENQGFADQHSNLCCSCSANGLNNHGTLFGCV